MSFLTKSCLDGFDFVHVDIAKLYTIVRTHKFNDDYDLVSPAKSSTDLYFRFIDSLTNLWDDYNLSSFSKAEVHCELVECFTAQVLSEYEAFATEDLSSYYLAALEIFTDTDRRLGFNLFVTMCHQMDWTQYGVHLMSRIANFEVLLSKCGSFKNEEEGTSSYLITLFFKQLYYYLQYNSENKSTSFPIEINSNSSNDSHSQLMTQMNIIQRNVLDVFDFVYANNNYDDSDGGTSLDNYRNEFVASSETLRQIVLNTKSILMQHFSSIHCEDSLYNYATDVQDALLFFISTLKFIDVRLDCHLFDDFQVNDSICLEYFEKRYGFMEKLYFLARIDRPQLASFFYRIMLHNIDFFQDCSLFDCIKRRNYKINSVKSTFWNELFNPNQIQRLTNNYFFIFEIISMTSNSLQEKLFEFSFNLLLKDSVDEVSYVNQLFERRLQLFQLSSFELCRKRLPSNFIECCNKSQLDLHNEQIKEIVFETFKSMFCTPMATFDSILYQVLVHRPATCQSIACLLAKPLKSVLSYPTSTVDILTDNSLSLLPTLLVKKLMHNFDFISLESLFDLLTCIAKLNPTLVNLEQLFVNLVAYNSDRLSSQFHQTLHRLIEYDKETKWSGAKFVYCNIYFLSILYECWQSQAKKEIITSILYQYHDKCDHIKLNQVDLARIDYALDQVLKHQQRVPRHLLLFYLNKCLTFPHNELVSNDQMTILYYAAISADNSWLVSKHKSQSSGFNQDPSYSKFFKSCFWCITSGNDFIYLTQQEWQNLIEFANQFYSTMIILGGIVFTLLKTLQEFTKYTTEALVYFSRSILRLFDEYFQQIKYDSPQDILEYFFAWLSLASINMKFEANPELNYSLNEVSIEVKRMLDSGNMKLNCSHNLFKSHLLKRFIELCDLFIANLPKELIEHSADLKRDLFDNCSDSIQQAFLLHCDECTNCLEGLICKTD